MMPVQTLVERCIRCGLAVGLLSVGLACVIGISATAPKLDPSLAGFILAFGSVVLIICVVLPVAAYLIFGDGFQ